MWYFDDKPFTQADVGNFVGFVYRITDLENGMMYIGKKVFKNTKKLPPLKGKTRKRTKITESDWQEYYGSNEKIKALVEEHGPERFHRQILHLCRSKAECTYWESKLQFQYDVLIDDRYYNDMIMCRISGSHLRALKD